MNVYKEMHTKVHVKNYIDVRTNVIEAENDQ